MKPIIAKTEKQKAAIAEKITKSGGIISVEIKYLRTRTSQQNASLHLYCDLLAEKFNDAGYTIQYVMSKFLKEIPWTMPAVKENIWRVMQKALTRKESTTELNRMEPSDIYMHIDVFTSTEFGISVPWPSIESMEDEAGGTNHD